MAKSQTLDEKIYLTRYYTKKFFSKFETSPLITAIWLEISINWYAKSQGLYPCPAPPTLLVIGVVLLHTL